MIELPRFRFRMNIMCTNIPRQTSMKRLPLTAVKHQNSSRFPVVVSISILGVFPTLSFFFFFPAFVLHNIYIYIYHKNKNKKRESVRNPIPNV